MLVLPAVQAMHLLLQLVVEFYEVNYKILCALMGKKKKSPNLRGCTCLK